MVRECRQCRNQGQREVGGRERGLQNRGTGMRGNVKIRASTAHCENEQHSPRFKVGGSEEWEMGQQGR